MSITEKTFQIPASLLQAVINNLEEQPARVSRTLLNHIEELVRQQQAPASMPAPEPAPVAGAGI